MNTSVPIVDSGMTALLIEDDGIYTSIFYDLVSLVPDGVSFVGKLDFEGSLIWSKYYD